MTDTFCAEEWVRASPPLYRSAGDIQLADAYFKDVTVDPQSAPLAPSKDQRLGRRVEQLVQRLIEAHPDLNIIAQNIAIRDTQRTVGELDLLVHDTVNDLYQHWEVTLKFYLGVSATHWPGPNPSDNLRRKARRMFDHQFPLSNSPLCHQRLQELGIPRIDEKRLLSRGALFYPATYELPPPAESHPLHTRGTWWLDSELPASWQWEILPREQWIGMSSLSDKGITLLATHQMVDYVQSARSPVMVFGHQSQSSSVASKLGFIVTDQWLADAKNTHSGKVD